MKIQPVLALSLFLAIVPSAHADQGSLTNTGGMLAGTTVANPPGTLAISSGTLSFVSSDGATVIQASFSDSSTVENCSGGGIGSHVSCAFTFTGKFSGTLTANGSTQAINGSTSQIYGTDQVIVSGSTFYNSAYTPFYFSNTGQILRSDDLSGTNLITYGTAGNGVGQFYGAYSVALDSLGRIYVADTYNSRIVRIDDMNGTNWTSYGTGGSDVGQFSYPQGISVDSAGRIYVMDTGNGRLVRIDDLNGTNWTTVSGYGSGVGQFAQYVAPVAFDASGRIYVADAGNQRIVRMDDMNATNWTTLTQSPVTGIYGTSFASPVGIALDPNGKIYVVDSYSQHSLVRVDDMTGANWTSVNLGANATPNSIAIDSTGMVLVGGGGAQVVDDMAGLLRSSGVVAQYGYYVFGATPVPLPSPRPSAIRLSSPGSTLAFSQQMGTSVATLSVSQDVGTSATQTITISNFGGTQLNGLGIVFTSDAFAEFSETNDCTVVLLPGASCTVSITFAPTIAGQVTAGLTVSDDSGNMGPGQIVWLNGTGTVPVPPVVVPPPDNGLNNGGNYGGNVGGDN